MQLVVTRNSRGESSFHRKDALKITSPLEEAVVDTGTFQLPSFANVVKVGSSLNWWQPPKYIMGFGLVFFLNK